jgi:hypothetical protein
LRTENGESVVFEELNPGVLTRIWMTSGNGTSLDLNPNVNIKFYFDDSDIASIDLPLPDLFNGNTPPFTYPLAADRLRSSGGNYSYVPISYKKNLKITLTNAIDYKLWFQFDYQRLASNSNIVSFNINDRFDSLTELLNSNSQDWSSSDAIVMNTITLEPNKEHILFNRNNSGWIKSIVLKLSEKYFDSIILRFTFDDNITSELSLRDYFAIGQNNGVITQSLFLGINQDDELYSYFPMPYQKNAKLSIIFQSTTLTAPELNFKIGYDTSQPDSMAGIFSTQIQNTCPTIPFIDSPILEVY